MKLRLSLAALLLATPLAAQDLPTTITALNLADMHVEEKRRGTEITGTLPSGTRIEIEIKADGTLDSIETKGMGFFTLVELGDLIPAGLARYLQIPAYSQLTSLEIERNGNYDIEGFDETGREFDAEISNTGEELKYEFDN